MAFAGVFSDAGVTSALFSSKNKYIEEKHVQLKPTENEKDGNRDIANETVAKRAKRHGPESERAAHGEPSTSGQVAQPAKRVKAAKPKERVPKSKKEKKGAPTQEDEGKKEGADGSEKAQHRKPKREIDPEAEAEKLKRTVFMGNVPLEATRKAVKRLMAEVGSVESVRLRSIPVDPTKSAPKAALVKSKQLNKEHRSSMSAYVVFATADEAKAATKLNMTEWMGKHIRVDMAKEQTGEGSKSTGALYDTKRTVFIGNLPFDVEDEDILKLFQAKEVTKKEPELKGAVQGVRCVRDGRSGLGKGIAYLLLRDTEAAKAAVRVGKELEMVGRKLRVTRALAKPPGKEGAAGKGGKGGKVVKGVKGDKGGRGGATREKSSAPPRQREKGRKETKTTKEANWQGLRVKGGGVQKKKGHASRNTAGKAFKDQVSWGPTKTSGRTAKRPAVAARKSAGKGTK